MRLSRYGEIVDSILNHSNPPYGDLNVDEALDAFCVKHRIATDDYPASEARYVDIEEWERAHDDDFETLFRESLADAT